MDWQKPRVSLAKRKWGQLEGAEKIVNESLHGELAWRPTLTLAAQLAEL